MFTYVNAINLSIFLETVVMAHLFGLDLPKRGAYPLRLIGSTAVLGAAAYFIPLFPLRSFWFDWGYSVAMYLALLLFAVLSAAFCLRAAWINCLFCAVGGYAVHHLGGEISSILAELLWHGAYRSVFEPPYLYLYLLSMTATYAVVLALFRRNRSAQTLMNRRRVVLLALLVVTLNIVISSYAMMTEMYEDSIRNPVSAVDLYNCVSGFLAINILFGLLEHGRLEREAEILNNLYRENIRQYEVSKATMESLHDLKHRINALMAGNAALSEAERRDLSDKIFIFDSAAKTGNETLDIILTEKRMLCHQYGIEFDCMADGSRLAFMDVYELYSLFGNALSNAIEAAAGQLEGSPRLIFLSVSGSDRYTAVHIENTFNGQIRIVDGIPETNKPDRAAHGFGMKSMQRITEKYHGTMTVTVKDDLFHLDLLFPA
ncbi:MAG: sensor histidine kinase [Lachnospiraceae bacterium]|nr:sensor histidine kinase [Lachnospiraceae bacterium]